MPPKKAAEDDAPAARFGRVRSNLKMGLVGLPNVGKSSLFNLLCDQVTAVPAEMRSRHRLLTMAPLADETTALAHHCPLYAYAECSGRELSVLYPVTERQSVRCA